MGSGRAPGVQPALVQLTDGTKALLLRAADSRHRSPGPRRAERRPSPVRREVPGPRAHRRGTRRGRQGRRRREGQRAGRFVQACRHLQDARLPRRDSGRPIGVDPVPGWAVSVLRGAGSRSGAAGRRDRPGHGHRFRDRRLRADPDEQPRGGRSNKNRNRFLRRRGRHVLRGPRARPGSADRQRPAGTDRTAGRTVVRGAVRRFRPDGTGRLGDGHRQPVRLRPYGDRGGNLRRGTPLPVRARPLAGRSANGRGHQSGQLRRAAAQHPR